MGNMNQKGRTDRPRIIAIREDIYASYAYTSLTPAAKVIYMELRRRFKMNKRKGTNNNGEISLSVREARDIANIAQSTAQRALQELIEHGLIRIHNKGHYGNLHATTFILTDETMGNQAATNEWRGFREGKIQC